MSFNATGSGATLAAQFQVGEVVFDGTQQGGGLFQSMVVSTPGDYQLSVDIATERFAPRSNNSAGVYTLLLDGVAVDSF